MLKNALKIRWKTLSPDTRIGVSLAAAVAVILTSFGAFTCGPSLIDIHAWLYRHYETRDAIQGVIFHWAVFYLMGAEIVVALACRPKWVGKASAPEKKPFESARTVAVAALVGLLAFTSLVAVSWFAANCFNSETYSNWQPFGSVLFHGALYFVFSFFSLFIFGDSENKNPVSFFVAAKSIPVFALFLTAPGVFNFSLILGMLVLDALLMPLGTADAWKLSAETKAKD